MKMMPEAMVAIMIACGTVRLASFASSDKRRDRVETEERQAQDRRAGQDRAHAGRAAVTA